MNRILASLWANGESRLGLILLGIIVLIGLVGPFMVVDPGELVGRPLQPPSAQHWLGTTGQGQDVLAQVVVGCRVTLAVAFATGILVVAIGAFIGLLAATFGGWVDEALTLLTNVFLVLPGLPLMVVIAAWLPPGPWTMLGVLTVTGWAWNARVFRAQARTLRQRDFIAAAEQAGEPKWRIMVVEILPNMASILVSAGIGASLYAIGAQVGLEFLGLGDLDAVTWGTILYWATNDAALITGAWWTFVPTGVAIALTGFSLTLLNGALDELTNPSLRSERLWRHHVGERWEGATPVRRP